MDNIKDIIEKARAVVAAHEAYEAMAPSPERVEAWDAVCAAESTLESLTRCVRSCGEESIGLARLLVSAAALPMDAFNHARALAVELTCAKHQTEGCTHSSCVEAETNAKHAAERKAAHRARRERRVDEPIWQRYYAAALGCRLSTDEARMSADLALTEHRKRWPHQD